MAAKKTATKKATATKAPAKKAPAAKSGAAAAKAPAKKAPAKKAAPTKPAAEKPAAEKAPAKKAPVKKVAAAKAAAVKEPVAPKKVAAEKPSEKPSKKSVKPAAVAAPAAAPSLPPPPAPRAVEVKPAEPKQAESRTPVAEQPRPQQNQQHQHQNRQQPHHERGHNQGQNQGQDHGQAGDQQQVQPQQQQQPGQQEFNGPAGEGLPGEGGGRRRRRRRRRRRNRRGGGGGDPNNPNFQQGQNGQPHQHQNQQQRNPQQQQQPGGDQDSDEYDGPDDESGDDFGDDDGDGSATNAQQQGGQQQPPPPPPFECEGILEWPSNGDGRIRQFGDGFIESPNDPWVPQAMSQQFPMRHAQRIVAEAQLRKPKRKRRGPRQARAMVTRIISIEGVPPEEYAQRKTFADFTALDPQPRISLEYKGCPPSCRLIDLFCPIGFGTRGLIVAPPKAGKTMLLQNIAYGIKRNHPEIELVALLIDERPEEVTDFKRNVPAHVLASSNDQDLDRHLALGILAIERAKRMVEAGRDVVVLLDSLTRLGRAFNNSRKYGSSGRTMSGGLDSRALEVPKQLFGAARKCEEGGSLTIIATCLVDTGSRADQMIFEEFKGTGNMELILDRSIAEKRLFPAINLAASGTRKEHLLMPDKEFKTVTALRRRLLAVPPHAQIEQLLAACQRFETNEQMVGGAS